MRKWRFWLGDLLGRPIANYSSLMYDVSIGYRHIRPEAIQFRVPSGHTDVARTFEDGRPMLESLRRTIRGYRYEWVADPPPGFPSSGCWMWNCRFAGIVWTLQDVGDHDAAWTTVTAFAPMQRLASRYTGTDEEPVTKNGGQVLIDLIDETNAKPGEAPLGGYTGIATSGFSNVYEGGIPDVTYQYDRRPIGDLAVELATAFNGFDPVFRPVHQAPGTEDGTLAALDIRARRGTDRPDAVFAWGMAPHNVSKIERLIDPSSVANALKATGGVALGQPEGTLPVETIVSTPASLAAYGRYESIEQYSDIVTQSFLDALMLEEASYRANPKEIVRITPAISDGTPRFPTPFDDFDIGDTVPVWASETLRGGFRGLQRVYGFGLAIDEQGVERVDQIIASPEEE